MNYIIVDLEATCEENNRSFFNEIIEIGAVKINDKLNIVDKFSMFVRPKLNPLLTEFCRTLTSITQSDVDQADTFDKVLSKFLEWIGEDEYIICSWGFYDKTQFTRDCSLYGLDIGWIDRHISLKHQHGEKIVGKKRGVGMKWALEKAGIELVGTHHRGIDDARNIAQLFLKYFDIWDFG